MAIDRSDAVITKGESHYIKLLALLTDRNRQALIDDWDNFIKNLGLVDAIANYKQKHPYIP